MILVPNVDNTRTDYLIETIARQGKAVLLIGEQVRSDCLVWSHVFTEKYIRCHIIQSVNSTADITLGNILTNNLVSMSHGINM